MYFRLSAHKRSNGHAENTAWKAECLEYCFSVWWAGNKQKIQQTILYAPTSRIASFCYEYNSPKCVDAVWQKLSKLVRVCRNYSIPQLARILRHGIWVTYRGSAPRPFRGHGELWGLSRSLYRQTADVWHHGPNNPLIINPSLSLSLSLSLSQARGYFPNRTASPPIGRYQISLLCDRGTWVWNDLSRVAGRKCDLQDQRPNHYAI